MRRYVPLVRGRPAGSCCCARSRSRPRGAPVARSSRSPRAWPCAPRPRATQRLCAPGPAGAWPRPRVRAHRCPAECDSNGARASRQWKLWGTSQGPQTAAAAARPRASHVAQVRQPPRLHGLHAPRGKGWATGRVRWPNRCGDSNVDTHVGLLAVAPLGLEDQRRQLRTAHVGLHNPRQTWLSGALAVAVNAGRLQPLHAVCEELPHWRNVVQLAGALRHLQPHSARKPHCTARTSCRCAAVGTSRLAFTNLRKTSCARQQESTHGAILNQIVGGVQCREPLHSRYLSLWRGSQMVYIPPEASSTRPSSI